MSNTNQTPVRCLFSLTGSAGLASEWTPLYVSRTRECMLLYKAWNDSLACIWHRLADGIAVARKKQIQTVHCTQKTDYSRIDAFYKNMNASPTADGYNMLSATIRVAMLQTQRRHGGLGVTVIDSVTRGIVLHCVTYRHDTTGSVT